MSRGIFYRIRKIHGQMHEDRIAFEQKLRQRAIIRRSARHSVFLVGTPIHPNIGDSAIVLAEIAFLKKVLPQGLKLVELTDDAFCKHRKLALRSILSSRALPVFWHGGGNMGDLWIDQEFLRRDAFSLFQQKRIISFPQTIYYSDTETGKRHAEASIPFYNGKTELTLTAREQTSYDIMKSLYPDTDLYLMPDIVLSSSAEDFGVRPQPRDGVLMCLRNDAEKSIQDDFWNDLKVRLDRLGLSYRVTDMDAKKIISTTTRAEIVRNKLQEFRGAELVITDRLHGMIFAALTGTPCVVFSNNNHKVKSSYEWVSYLPYIRYSETVEAAAGCIPELLAMENCKYDNTPLMPWFEKMSEIIREACG